MGKRSAKRSDQMLGKKREPGPFVDRVKRAQEMRLRQPGRSPSQQRRRKREACCGIAGHSGLPCRPLTANAKKFKAYPIGYFHIDIVEIQTAEGKL